MVIFFSLLHIQPCLIRIWRESGNLPSVVDTYAPGLLLWNGKVILMERETDNIWLMEENLQGRRLMDVTIGARFYGDYDNAVLVPDSWREGCA